MEFGQNISLAALGSHFFVGLSRAMILFTVSAGLSFVLGVLRVPNVAHGSLFMIGAFTATSISVLFGGGSIGFWLALILSPLIVALISLIAERSLFRHLYQREHLMLILFTFALMLILGDLVKLKLVRPISKRKRWLVVDIIAAAPQKDVLSQVDEVAK